MWRINVILELALLLTLVGRRVHMQWPALVAFLGALVARDAVLLWADWRQDKLVYFWAYYIGSVLADVAEVLLITEISLKLVGPLKCLRAIVARNVPAMTAVFIFCSILAAIPVQLGNGMRFAMVVLYYCRQLDLAVSVGCSCALIMLIGLTISLKIQFTHGVRPVVIGLLLESGLTYVQAMFVAEEVTAQSLLQGVRSAGFLITLVFFSVPALHCKRRRHLHDLTSPDQRNPQAQGAWKRC